MSLPWIKLFASLPRHLKSMHLDAALGRKRTWSHVVELWLWTSQYEPTGDLSGLTDRMIADVSGWRGKPEKFVAALKAAGFIDGDLRLVGWDEHQAAHVERAEFVASPAESTDPVDVAALRKAQASKRARDARARKRDAGVTRNAASRDGVTGSVTRSVTERDASRDENDAQAVPAPVSARAHASEIEIEKEIKTEKSEEHSSAVADASPLPPSKSSPKADATEAAITEVLEHWRDVVWVASGGKATTKIEGSGSEGRRKLIRPLLGDGWTVERLKLVADGHAGNDYLMGRDPKSEPGGWTEVENVFRRSKLDSREKAASAPRLSTRSTSVNVGINDSYGVGEPDAYQSSMEGYS